MKTILNHQLCQVNEINGKHQVLIAMSEGGFIEHEDFPGDQRGLVSAMSLAVDVLAGKVWLKKVHSVASKPFALLETGVPDIRRK